MRLVEQAFFFEFGHYVADRGCAQCFLKTPRECAGGYRFTLFDVHADDVRENQAISPLLERGILHTSTLLQVSKSLTIIVRTVSSSVNARGHLGRSATKAVRRERAIERLVAESR